MFRFLKRLFRRTPKPVHVLPPPPRPPASTTKTLMVDMRVDAYALRAAANRAGFMSEIRHNIRQKLGVRLMEDLDSFGRAEVRVEWLEHRDEYRRARIFAGLIHITR